jgi:acetyl esterase
MCQGAVVIDPQLQAVLSALDQAGAVPLVRGSAQQTRAHYRALSTGRRGPGFVPEAVTEIRDETIEGAGGPLPLRVYFPADDRGRVVTYLHGGGWVVGDLDTHDPVCRRVANTVGAVVVSVGYRLAPEHRHPGAVADTMAALAWSAETFPGRTVGIAGDSAGATLAAVAALATRGGGVELAAQMLLYPATDPTMSRPSVRENGEGYFLTRSDMEWFQRQYFSGGPEDASLDLLAADVVGAPAAVVATAEFDPLRDEGDAFAARLEGAGVRVRHLPGPGLIHGYFAFLGIAAAADAQSARVLAAFDELLG